MAGLAFFFFGKEHERRSLVEDSMTDDARGADLLKRLASCFFLDAI